MTPAYPPVQMVNPESASKAPTRNACPYSGSPSRHFDPPKMVTMRSWVSDKFLTSACSAENDTASCPWLTRKMRAPPLSNLAADHQRSRSPVFFQVCPAFERAAGIFFRDWGRIEQPLVAYADETGIDK